MSHYAIAVTADEASQEFQVVLRGPGIDPEGRNYVFRNTYRCSKFAEAVNFAYEQGLRDGARAAMCDNSRLWIVTGTTPENLAARPESWWVALKRRWLGEVKSPA